MSYPVTTTILSVLSGWFRRDFVKCLRANAGRSHSRPGHAHADRPVRAAPLQEVALSGAAEWLHHGGRLARVRSPLMAQTDIEIHAFNFVPGLIVDTTVAEPAGIAED